MKSPQSWASSIVGFALALLLAGWALQQFVALVMAVWPALAGLAVLVGIGLLARAY